MIKIKPVQHYMSERNFYLFILAALLLRVAIMPIFAHVDVLSEARRIYFWDQQGIYFDDISRNTTAIFQLLFFKVSSFFLSTQDILFFHFDMAHSTAHPKEYFAFVSQPTIFRALFLIKLPFLCADLLTAWAVYQFCGSNEKARLPVVFWLLNPITVYAFYIFGRFESIPILFCMLSLLALQRRALILASIMIALCVNAREMFIFLGPVFLALTWSPAAREYHVFTRIIASLIVLFGICIAVQIISFSGENLDAFGREVHSIASEGRVEYLFKFIVGSYLMFPMVYFFILMYAWNSSDSFQYTPLFVFAGVFFAFFAFSSHTAHYTSWLMVFPCVYLAYTQRLVKPMIMLCVTWVLFNLSITDKGVFTTWLASPLSIHFAGFPTFPEMYYALGLSQKLDMLTYQRLMRTFYMASILYIGAIVVLRHASFFTQLNTRD